MIPRGRRGLRFGHRNVRSPQLAQPCAAQFTSLVSDASHDSQGLPRTVAPFDTMTSMVASRQPISPQAAARYRERWAIARKRLNEELRATSMEAKLRQLVNLMQSAREMGWSRSLDEEDDAVRARWMALRRARLGNA